MLLSGTGLHITPFSSTTNHHFPFTTITTASLNFTTNASISSSFSSSSSSLTTNTNLLHYVTRTLPDDDAEQSASAVASAIRKISTSPIDFAQQIEKADSTKLVLPSLDFRRLCVEQFDLFRRIVDSDAILSVYVRPAGSYVMDRLEMRRVACYPCIKSADIVVLIANFHIPTGLRAAEAALASQQVEFVPEHRAVVFPMVKHPFVVGFLVAELPSMKLETTYDMNVQSKEHEHDLIPFRSLEEPFALPSSPEDNKSWGIQTSADQPLRTYNFTPDQRLNAINISCSLAMAYVMDQKAMLLQQSSWQNNVRMSNLVEQIRGPLSSIRTLSKMLSIQLKRNEISYDIVQDILVQGDCLGDTLQELQDAVHLTKANIMHYNEEVLQKINNSTHHHNESLGSQLSDSTPREADSNNDLRNSGGSCSISDSPCDSEMPMPPMALAPRQQYVIRPCNVSEVLSDLVGAVQPLACKQKRSVVLNELSQPLQVAIEEPALRQALSNLIEGALLRTHVRGKVEIVYTEAPAGGALVVIDDDGPDMHYMTQMHSLTPFGAELFSENTIDDNMTWNFVAGLTVAREILESYGCVVRVISPRITDAALGTGGTRVEIWLPSVTALSDLNGIGQKA